MSPRSYPNTSYLFDERINHNYCSELLLDIENCSHAYIRRLHELNEELWSQGALSMYLLFSICVFTNGTTLLVFSQRKYKTKIVPATLKFIYVANILYVGTTAFSNLSFPLREKSGFDGSIYCKLSYFMVCFLRGLTNWTLMVVSLIHVLTIYFPDNFLQFRKNPKNSWVIFTVVLLISSVLTIAFSNWHKVRTCQFYEQKFCTFPVQIPVWHTTLAFGTPMLGTFLCSISIAYSLYNPDVMPFAGIEMRTAGRLNRLVIGSTLMFIATSTPLLIHISLTVVEYGNIACTYFYYRKHLQRLTTMILTMISFSFDSLLFILISGPFRRDVVHIYKNAIYCCRKRGSVNKYLSGRWERNSSMPHGQGSRRWGKPSLRPYGPHTRRRSSIRALAFTIETAPKLSSSQSSTSI